MDTRKLSDAQRVRFRELFGPAWEKFKRDAHPATTRKADLEVFYRDIYPAALAELERVRAEALAEAAGS